MPLSLSLHEGQHVCIGDSTVTIRRIGRYRVILSCDAPPDVLIHRADAVHTPTRANDLAHRLTLAVKRLASELDAEEPNNPYTAEARRLLERAEERGL